MCVPICCIAPRGQLTKFCEIISGWLWRKVYRYQRCNCSHVETTPTSTARKQFLLREDVHNKNNRQTKYSGSTFIHCIAQIILEFLAKDPKYQTTLPHYFRSYNNTFDLSGVIPIYSRTLVLESNIIIGTSVPMPRHDPKVPKLLI